MVDLLKPEEVMWDVVSGVSAGSLNGGSISTFAPGDEKAMSKFMDELWKSMSNEKVWELWNDNWTAHII